MNSEHFITWALLTIILIIVGHDAYKKSRTTIRSTKRSTLIDTSVLIDGRIVSIASSGFLGDTLVIPRSVVGELQVLADKGDADKRARARMGLDVITQLQALPEVTVELLQDSVRAAEGVDDRLLTLAKANNASLCTIDYNLNKVAVVEGVKVLNINELAQGLRLAHLPGEVIQVDLIQKGQDSHQAVGYLSDGTMVVVENAHSQIGTTVTAEVIRSLQTAAGKMMFARLPKTKVMSNSSSPKLEQRVQKRTNQVTKITPKHTGQASGMKKPVDGNNGKTKRGKRNSQKDRESAFIAMIDSQE